jgi:phosphate-selective porin OprO/OprP
MKTVSRTVAVIFLAFAFSLSAAGLKHVQAEEGKTVQEEILDILKQEGTIAPERHDELIKKAREEEVKASKGPRVGSRRGLFFESPETNSRLQPYLKLRVQYNAFEANNPASNGFSIRHARLGLEGIIYQYYDFNVAGEFGKGSHELWDAYMGFNYLPWAQLRVGQYKQPFSLEWCSPVDWRDFIEMPLPIDNLTPDRDIGLMVHGNMAKGVLNYGLSLYNGAGRNTSDTNDDKDVAARVVLTPFNASENAPLKGLHFGGSITYGNQETERDEMRRKGKFQTAGETAFFQFNEDVFHDGERIRYGAELAWILGPFSLKGEWVRMDLDDLYVKKGGSKDDFSIDGSYVSLSYILTGESQPFKDGTYGMISPKQAFDPKKGTWGAIQLVARYETLSIDNDLFLKGYADAGTYTSGADGFTVGVNWYLNDAIRAMVNYNHTDFDGHIVKDTMELKNEDLVLVQLQLVL